MSKLPLMVTWMNLLVIEMTAFTYAPSVEGPHHGPGHALVPGKRGMQSF